MSMSSPNRYTDPNAQAKSMIDAVAGHQPSPLDGDYSSEKPVMPRQKFGEKDVKSRRDA